jgi:hypothetical protein
MAELGSINFTDVNRGTRSVDRSAEARALGSVLNVGKQIAEEGIKAKVTRDFNEAIDDAKVSTDALVVTGASSVEEMIAGTDKSQLSQNIDKWKLQAEQGSSSQRTLAEIKIKEILNDAQGRYPWMVEELQQRAGLVIAGSHELAETGLFDAAARSSSANAKSEIDRLQTYATKDWESGGLGISPHLEVGSAPWLAQYEERDTLRQQQQKNARYIGMVISNREATAIEIEGAASTALQGKFSSVRTSRLETFNSNGFDAALLEAVKGEGANLEVLAQFHAGGRTIIIDDLEQQKVEAIALYQDWFRGPLAGTAAGVRTKAQLDDFIAEQDSIINKFRQGVESMPDALKQIEIYNGIRSAEVMRGMTESYKNVVAFIGQNKSVLDLAALAQSGDGLSQRNKLGNVGVGILQSQFPEFLGAGTTEPNAVISSFLTSGQNSITPAMAPLDINKRLDKLRSDSSSPWYITTKTDRDEVEAAFWSVDNHTRLWDAALTAPENYATPAMAATYLTGVNNSLRTFNFIDEKPKDVEKVIRSALSDDRLLVAVDTIGDDPATVNQRRAFGASAKEWYENTDPTARQQETAVAYNNQRIEGIPLRELAKADITQMSTSGNFTYIPNAAALERAVDKRLAKENQRSADTRQRARSRVQVREDIRLELVSMMEPIVQEVNESITISRNLDHATAINSESRRNSNVKLQFFDELGWLGVFNYEQPGT